MTIDPSHRRGYPRLAIVVVCAMAASACVPSTALVRPGLPEKLDASRVLLMEPDVQLSVMTASGLEEPNAAWTEQGSRNVRQALAKITAERGVDLIGYAAPGSDPERLRAHQQLRKLYQAVGVTILTHQYNPALALPTKADRFDWTLGPAVRQLKDEYEADYALFVYLHDSYASAGRVGVMLIAAAFGVGLTGGIQAGFASLVDLSTGDLVWFNRLVRATGDLRAAEPAHEAVELLLAELPLL